MHRIEVVALAGGPRALLAGRLDSRLPAHLRLIDDSKTVLGGWSSALHDSRCRGDVQIHPVAFCLVSQLTPCFGGILRDAGHPALQWTAHVDESSNRGPAGVLADLIRQPDSCNNADWLLVLDAAASPAVSVNLLFDKIGDSADCILGASELGRYCGCLLVRRHLLQLVPSVGFCDLREQFLKLLLARGAALSKVTIAPRALRLWGRESWIQAVAAWEQLSRGSREASSRALDFRRVGSCAIDGRAVVKGATIVSSVVMAGAVVRPGALVARSVVGPGVVVPAGEVVVDQALVV